MSHHFPLLVGAGTTTPFSHLTATLLTPPPPLLLLLLPVCLPQTTLHYTARTAQCVDCRRPPNRGQILPSHVVPVCNALDPICVQWWSSIAHCCDWGGRRHPCRHCRRRLERAPSDRFPTRAPRFFPCACVVSCDVFLFRLDDH